MMFQDKNPGGRRRARAVSLTLGACMLTAGLAGAFSVRSGLNPSLQRSEPSETVTYVHIAERTPPETTAAPETEQPAGQPAQAAGPEETAPVFENASPTVPAPEAETAWETPVFSPPLSFRIGDDYSMGIPVFSDTMGDYRTHNGVDFPGEAGSPVTAAAAGTVRSVKHTALYGGVVEIDHGGGIVSTVSGLADEGLIEPGAAVTGDSVIGVVGRLPAEEKEGAHVHLEIRIDGALTDPLELLGLSENEDERP